MYDGVSLPTKDLKFLPLVICFSVNIPVYGIEFKLASDVSEHLQDERLGF